MAARRLRAAAISASVFGLLVLSAAPAHGAVVDGVDLAVTKTANDPTPDVGQPVIFTITVTNNGGMDASGVAVTEALPAGLSFVSAFTGYGTFNSSTGVWSVNGLNAGITATLTIAATRTTASELTNTASVTAMDQVDANPGDNSASVTLPAVSADLELAKTVNDPTADVGDTVTFTVTVTNQGGNGATNVGVTDSLPAGLSFTTATPSQGSYSSGTGVWTVGSLSDGAAATLAIVAQRTSNVVVDQHSDHIRLRSTRS